MRGQSIRRSPWDDNRANSAGVEWDPRARRSRGVHATRSLAPSEAGVELVCPKDLESRVEQTRAFELELTA
jgi:hypothetical protein